MILFANKKTLRAITCKLRIATAVVTVCMLAGHDLCAQKDHARSPITPSQIIQAMQDQQLSTNGAQVSLAVPITSISAKAALEVAAVAPINSQDIRLRIACRNRSECLPFFAVAHYPQAIDAAAFQIIAAHAIAQAAPTTNSASQNSSDKLTDANVHSGAPATLNFDSERVHVRVEVICLESGAAGDNIRVTARDHKQNYLAEIVTPKTLKGVLAR